MVTEQRHVVRHCQRHIVRGVGDDLWQISIINPLPFLRFMPSFVAVVLENYDNIGSYLQDVLSWWILIIYDRYTL